MYNQPENESEFVTVYCVYQDMSYDGDIPVYYTFSEQKANEKLEVLKKAVKEAGYSDYYELMEIKVEK